MARSKATPRKLRNAIASLSTGSGPYYSQFSHYWERLVNVCREYGYVPSIEGVPEVLGPPVETSVTILPEFHNPSTGEVFNVCINDYRMPSFQHEIVGYCTNW
jgi:hypothetical protein